MVYKILKGNSFYLHVLIDKVEITEGSRRSTPVDVLGLQDLVVKMLGDFYCCETYVLKEAKRTRSEVVCLIPPTMDIGNYSLQVAWRAGEKQLTSKERGIVQIVSDNRQTMVPAGVMDGECSEGSTMQRRRRPKVCRHTRGQDGAQGLTIGRSRNSAL